MYTVVDPATGKQIADYPTISDADATAAVAKAHQTYRTWSRSTTVAERAALIKKVAELHTERRDQLAATIVREMGKPLGDALGEVDFSAAIYEYYADNAVAFLADEPITLLEGEGSAVIQRRPLGVLLGIMPWNFPAYQVARFAGPNLAAGNTIVLKHAPQCPESAAALEQIFRDAGFPEGAYVNVYATNEQIETLIADPRVQGVSLTGSERAGSAVAEIAGRHLKKVVLELGGSDPFIVLSSDDLDATVDAAVAARLDNTGQACNAGKRMIVHEDLYDAFLSRFTDRILGTPPAPLSSLAAAERLDEQVTSAVSEGASLATAGQRDGAWYPPGVLTGIEAGTSAYQQELFGPVAMVFKVRDEDEAIEVANDTPYGLGSYVFTTDPAQAQRVADRIEAGMVFINGVGAEGPELPFGGVKRSGFGRELGRYGIEEFINRKLVRTVG
ncbi:succinate-semialdehyde dehydrogenase/glutarate-semialdehyde dehydrogenase [Actinoplanes lutulentus]|uniref:Succinate-semialdehyde dehydrogenase/glutarate-semialdehyde dehydrogenase n=1 Tax=Actinoplanes lutulentus TaxID=1287878 RepID=A0A327Z5Y6_9ACTN|nr:NAD-dependent succinate-semialdehyde dehydrogenase [Actinoplanes lutulentus]MBB2948896.1 succinate-semialdehyde dehydrogenase/glutarate-semialdehyde dehydrogenase [Actinoplanes lutulentus]RAK31485.1 succinate-semialdehyde dehydrogenase/glutarate-semialdehyde dehydrogenase [Actinoplanes lutulentus]